MGGSCAAGARQTVASLTWSADSEFLAVVVVEEEGAASAAVTSSDVVSLQLWHRSNWHWYLKQERCFGGCGGGLSVAWGEGSAALQLHSVTWSGVYRKVGGGCGA